MKSITIEVEGRPPPKSAAKSVLAHGGTYEHRVLALLNAAKGELERVASRGFGSALVRLEVEVHTGPGEPPWDATNYLGGIADVLERKDKRRIAQPGSVDFLGPLAEVGLYDDDRQIKEIVYREVEDSVSRYLVTLSALVTAAAAPKPD